MLQAKGDYIFFLAADGSTVIQGIDSFMLKFSARIDIYCATKTIKRQVSQIRKFFVYGYSFMTDLLLGLPLVEITYGLIATPAQALVKYLLSRRSITRALTQRLIS